MSLSSDQQLQYNYTGLSTSISGEITVAAVILIFILFIIIFILYIRNKHYSGVAGSSRSSRRLNFAPPNNSTRHALDPEVLKSLPITVFRSEDFAKEGGLECAVCLSELTDGEEARLLPQCNHGFHVECIDMWFHSNSTCPLCRNLVAVSSTDSVTKSVSVDIPVVDEGCLDEGSSSSSVPSSSSSGSCSMLVIEIPKREMNGFSSTLESPLPSSKSLAEGMIKSPHLERLKSLRRLLSRGNKGTPVAVGSSCGHGGYDIEQGIMSSGIPKAPKNL